MDKPDSAEIDIRPKTVSTPSSTLSRLIKYTSVKALTLAITVIVGLYITILVINLGGYVDTIFKAIISESLASRAMAGWLRDETPEDRQRIIEETRDAMYDAAGLNDPFLFRTARWLWNGLRLDLGVGRVTMGFNSYQGTVREIIISRLPYTLLMVGLANVFIFFGAIFLALIVSRNYGSFFDRTIMLLAPLTSAPSWVIGIILITILAGQLHLLPFPKFIDAEPSRYTSTYLYNTLQQMIMPVIAIFIAAFFQTVYTWRTFFLIYSEEDYVEYARAKGLPERTVERRFILRPVLPYVLTSFATMMILLWQEAIALELLFKWPGIGNLFINAVKGVNTNFSLGVVVLFAYLLAITLFVLDFLYALVDPRVRIGGNPETVTSIKGRKRSPGNQSHTPPSFENKENRLTPPQTQFRMPDIRKFFKETGQNFLEKVRASRQIFFEIIRSPASLVGLVIISILILTAIVTVTVIPYNRVVSLWRGAEGDAYLTNWYRNPKTALPVWVNFFRKNKLPNTIVMQGGTEEYPKTVTAQSEQMNEISFTFPFNYQYDDFPQDIVVYLSATYKEKLPFLSFIWKTPDGRKIDLGGFSIDSRESYYLTRDEKVKRKLKEDFILRGLFTNPEDPERINKGQYILEISAFTFEPENDVTAEAIIYGKTFGLAGTDHERRDLMIPLLWGIPVALVFGILGAVGTSLIAMLIAATGVWMGGWIDNLIQRITEVNMIMPSLLIAVLVFLLYSKSIWVMLGVIVLLNIFSSGIKNYRSVFLQVKNAPYIEAARAYGSSNWRMIRKYMVPFIMPVFIPQLITMVPVFIFYEATLAYLGLSDPYLPTWGKIIFQALSVSTLQENPHWFLEPVAMLMFTALGFALLGFSLERILNPRLRKY